MLHLKNTLHTSNNNMIHFSTTFCCTPLHSLLSKFLILLCFRNIYSSSSSVHILPEHFYFSFVPRIQSQCWPPTILKREDVVTVAANLSKVHSLKAAIFHTMAFKLSLEINKNKITQKSLIAFLKVLYNISKIKKKKVTFEQYSRIHLDGPKIAICETASNVVFVLNSSFQDSQHSSGLWLYANSRTLQFVYPSGSPSAAKSTIQ